MMDINQSSAGSSSLGMEGLSGGPSISSSEVPVPAPVPVLVANPPKRGRPRKVALEGEEQRRKQMKVRQKRKKTDSIHHGPKEWKWQRAAHNGVKVNTKKMYLPEGWVCFATKRSAGIHKGLHDLIYLSPNGDRIRSRNELFRWKRLHKSDIDPLGFLFTRTLDVLLDEENAKSIIFREAGLKGKAGRYTDQYVDWPYKRYKRKKACNTIFTERGKELLMDDSIVDSETFCDTPDSFQNVQNGLEESESTVINEEESSSTPKKKKRLTEPRRIPLEKTLACLKSPYFALKSQIPIKPVSIHAIHNMKWIPPRSPFNLIQEDLYHNPWQLLIATIFLNCTTGKLAIPVIHEFLARWPSPHEACSASLYDIVDVVELLGLGRTRAATILRFSHEYLTVDWKKPTELFGIGKYGSDSYKVFCLGQWRTVESDDKYLNMYINWLHNVCAKPSSSDRSRGSTALVPK